MKSGMGTAAFLLAALTGCGGGSASVDVNAGSPAHPFVIWVGNSSGDQVVDANNHVFAFYADSGCLYNFQTGRENTSFCLTSSGDTALYGGFPIRIANVRSSTGPCVAALIDEATARFIDIELDAFGREVVLVTQLGANFCPA
jgi:hypothetical protein